MIYQVCSCDVSTFYTGKFYCGNYGNCLYANVLTWFMVHFSGTAVAHMNKTKPNKRRATVWQGFSKVLIKSKIWAWCWSDESVSLWISHWQIMIKESIGFIGKSSFSQSYGGIRKWTWLGHHSGTFLWNRNCPSVYLSRAESVFCFSSTWTVFNYYQSFYGYLSYLQVSFSVTWLCL